jgi:hypothetical protein
MRITQSFYKAFKEYIEGNKCGNIIRHCWVDGKLLHPSKAMKLGQYFEYCLTGALPKEGKVPVPEYMKSGKDMMEPYRKAYNDAKYVKRFFTEGDTMFIGFKIVSVGDKLVKKMPVSEWEGTVDIIAEAVRDIQIVTKDGKKIKIKKGERVVIDVKYSGLLEDKWSPMGWSMETDIQKEHHKIQAIQYHLISDLKFFYLVVDSSHKEKDEEGNPINPDIKFMYIPVDADMVEMHLNEGDYLLKKFNFEKSIGFAARPSLSSCNKCPLKDECKDRTFTPNIEVVNVNTD